MTLSFDGPLIRISGPSDAENVSVRFFRSKTAPLPLKSMLVWSRCKKSACALSVIDFGFRVAPRREIQVETAVGDMFPCFVTPSRPGRDDVDDSVQRIGAVQRGACSFHDFDAFDVLNREAREIDRAADSARDPLAVDQHQDVLGIHPLHADPRTGKGAKDIKSGVLFEKVSEVLGTRRFDLLVRDDLR